jgi:hypothetical protein
VQVWIEISVMNRNEHVTTCGYAVSRVSLPILKSHFALSSTQNRSMYFESSRSDHILHFSTALEGPFDISHHRPADIPIFLSSGFSIL